VLIGAEGCGLLPIAPNALLCLVEQSHTARMTNSMDIAEMNARLEAFKTPLVSKTDEELFLAYRSIEDAKKGAKTETATVNRKTCFIKGCKPKRK
jgi:hypothetical protein